MYVPDEYPNVRSTSHRTDSNYVLAWANRNIVLLQRKE